MLVKKDRGAMVDFLISKTMTPSHAAKVHSERGTDVYAQSRINVMMMIVSR
jgi:hypothetical protein